LERAAIVSSPPTLVLAESLVSLPSTRLVPTPPGEVKPMREAMRETILTALAQSKNRIRGEGGAAELLGVKPTTLEARMKKLAIITK
jgi:formate hydrogenlyase transcriptional activator